MLSPDGQKRAFEALKSGLDIRRGGQISSAGPRWVPSGIAELDRALGGGFASGSIGTLEGPVSSGRTALAARLLAGATALGLAAAIDDGSCYPPDLARAGVELDRLLLVSAQERLAVGRAADILLRSKAFAVVTMPAVGLRATVWSRLSALAHKADALLLAIGAPQDELSYFATTRVRCGITRIVWNGAAGPFGQLLGYEMDARVLKNRRAAPGSVAHLCIHTKVA